MGYLCRGQCWVTVRSFVVITIGQDDLVGQDREVEKYRCQLTISRVLAGRRGALLTHSKETANPDTFGNGGSGRRRRAAPL